jgi:uncharacterized protein (DUF983 family)
MLNLEVSVAVADGRSPIAVSRGQAVRRGLAGRCPRCGGRGIFKGVMDLTESCPTCGLAFEREEGYWVGAMIVIFALVEVVFGAVFVGGMLLTWPDVPWTGLLITGLVLNGVVPFVGYGWAKAIWLGFDRGLSDVDG